ncbi:hypothetical protein I305_03079 [Cryptococcus gattii E566]|uniref:Zn(2)-C6 fungal-type domain-containing protein n=2 Tax=Cryptococcus gattii TaxID=37769 RepID=E6QZE4_CRYGW|nr:Hypothetical Protein CGB_A2290C [Cryptococcus gattii WM276]ADV19518.1 Hypothetical Protein CGB_A2290C [Cryptococcus gattii WM276]KIR80058.1 hypothetical protein I306_03022 [Cryptococcus gattii EJB2]KIY34299.1 hypothetical protein I305_03079 [Cryptococcus gattii E566]
MARSRRSTGDTLEGGLLGSEMQSRSPHNATDFLVEPSSSAPRSAAHSPLSSSGRELVDGRPPNLPSITDWNSTKTPRSGPIKPTLSSLVSNFRFLASSSTRPFTAGPSRANPGFSSAPRHPPPPRAVTQPQLPTLKLIPPIRSNIKSQPQPPLQGAVASPSMRTLTQPLYPPFARGPFKPIVHKSQNLRCPEHMPNSVAPIHPAHHDPPDWQGQVPVDTRFHPPQVHPPPFYSLSSPESPTNSREGLAVEPVGSNRQRKRQLISCYPCRKRKIRCDGRRPVCEQCERRKIVNQCGYAESIKRRKRVRDSDENDRER